MYGFYFFMELVFFRVYQLPCCNFLRVSVCTCVHALLSSSVQYLVVFRLS
eukprot:m.55191 g.55191  ORF g.55191 m.55191 type:complete len:50 (-) comp12931_c0_seq1:271-420(-)